MKKLAIVLEFYKGEFSAWIRSEGDFLISTVGLTPDEVIASLKALLQDWIDNEGQENPKWMDAKVSEVEFDVQYCLTGFFQAFDDVKLTAIARRTGISHSLIKRYASGFAYPSKERVKVIEKAIQGLGEELSTVELVYEKLADLG